MALTTASSCWLNLREEKRGGRPPQPSMRAAGTHTHPDFALDHLCCRRGAHLVRLRRALRACTGQGRAEGGEGVRQIGGARDEMRLHRVEEARRVVEHLYAGDVDRRHDLRPLPRRPSGAGPRPGACEGGNARPAAWQKSVVPQAPCHPAASRRRAAPPAGAPATARCPPARARCGARVGCCRVGGERVRRARQALLWAGHFAISSNISVIKRIPSRCVACV